MAYVRTIRNPFTIYKGFRIIQVTCVYRREWRNETHYTFCKDGDEKKPSKYYNVMANNIAKCKECIDAFIEDNTTYFTAEEIKKYVSEPNRKCGYAYGYTSLMKVMRQHQKADKRVKVLLENRLSDANFHSACSYLSDGDYEGFEKFVADDCRFREKFEIYTLTMRKRIKDPKRLEDGLNKVIADYLESNGIKDTDVEVRFVEDW